MVHGGTIRCCTGSDSTMWAPAVSNASLGNSNPPFHAPPPCCPRPNGLTLAPPLAQSACRPSTEGRQEKSTVPTRFVLGRPCAVH